MATVNMALDLPTVSTTIGPTWATQLNTAIETIDSHDHTSGKGVQIPTSGLNINASLEFNSNSAVEITFLGLESQGSAPSTNLSIYVDGSNDLYYVNGSGTSVQITDGNALTASTAAAITYKAITTTPYTVLSTDTNKALVVDTSSAKTLNLPSAANAMWLYIKDQDGTAGTNNITISPNGSDTIDGSNSDLVMTENWGSRTMISDGSSAWYVI
jgi:hypothetical protein